jgi:hypothetical protein
MDQELRQRTHHELEEQDATVAPPPDKQPWQEPKLAFVEPKLTKHGELTAVTGQGFFGTFVP